MEASLLATKTLTPPSRPRVVARPRLFERLDEGLCHDLVLVSAPAGFGKTTLVVEWARKDRPQVHICWVSLDEDDGDPVRFFEYLILALQGYRPGLGETVLAWLHSSQPPPARAALVALMNELVGLAEDLVIVLDDFQFVTSADVHEAVSHLLDHFPPRLHLLLATRADPPLPLARLRGRGQLLEIGADDLRFTIGETAELLRELRGTPLADDQVAALVERTEGWAVGLKMAAVSMGEHEDISAFIKSFTGSQHYVTDYLIEEVLQRQAADVQDFLLKTSVLERLTGPLCDAITGRTDSRALLPSLERANLLLAPLDESRQWYRYEHLFADLLRHQLTMAVGGEAVAELHRLASGWYRANGLPREAVDHALAARDWELAADLLTETSDRYERAGEMVTLHAWLQALPEEILLARERLAYSYFVALVSTSRLDEAETLLDHMKSVAGDDLEGHARVTAGRSLVESLRGNLVRSMELAQQALPLLPASDADVWRGILSWSAGVLHWAMGRFQQAEPLLWESYRYQTSAGGPWDAMPSLVMLAYISRSRGDLSRSLELLHQALRLAPSASPRATAVHALLAAIHYERNDLEAAMAHNTVGLRLNQLAGDQPTQMSLLLQVMRVAAALGDEAGARQALERLDLFVADAPSQHPSLYLPLSHMLLAMRQGDLDEASRWGNQLTRLDTATPITFLARLILIQLLGILGRNEELSQQVPLLYQTAGMEPLAPEWKGWLLYIRVAQALCATDPDEALGFLAEALRVGEPEGWIRSFVDLGPWLAPLLRRAVSREICPEYAANLLTIIEAEERRKAQAGPSTRTSAIYALLTERELEILRLAGAGMSNRQIASRLFISLGTVKAHLHNISKKLNATSRTGAVARARELKLL